MLEVKAYVTNLGKYNEGYLIGEWVTFPLSDEEMAEMLKRIEISDTPDADGNYYEEYFVTDYDSDLPLYKYFGEYPQLSELNRLAESIDALSEYDQRLLAAVLDSGDYDDIWEALDHLGEYSFYEDMTGAEYEERLVSECYDLDNLISGWLSAYITIDYEAMFRDDYSDVTEVDGGVLVHY